MPGDVCPAYNSSLSKAELKGLGVRCLAKLKKGKLCVHLGDTASVNGVENRGQVPTSNLSLHAH